MFWGFGFLPRWKCKSLGCKNIIRVQGLGLYVCVYIYTLYIPRPARTLEFIGCSLRPDFRRPGPEQPGFPVEKVLRRNSRSQLVKTRKLFVEDLLTRDMVSLKKPGFSATCELSGSSFSWSGIFTCILMYIYLCTHLMIRWEPVECGFMEYLDIHVGITTAIHSPIPTKEWDTLIKGLEWLAKLQGVLPKPVLQLLSQRVHVLNN